jgi:ankyrin repeat protein
MLFRRTPNGDDERQMHNAAYGADVKAAKTLLDRFPSLAGSKHSRETPLHTVAKRSNRYYYQDRDRLLEVAKLLLAKGAPVNATTSSGQTPLHIAAEEGFKYLAELLLGAGADVDARTNDGDTPLHIAAEKGHEDLVKLLLANGADVDARNRRGKTALDGASYGSYILEIHGNRASTNRPG